jgi:hypothetical protein
METITKKINLNKGVQDVYHAFILELKNWWPRMYTWSKESLSDIYINAVVNGMCTEIGPYGFRVDWGRVVDLVEHQKVHIKWQISPQRAPEPNPEKCSDVMVSFHSIHANSTVLELQHFNFQNHGEEGQQYRLGMDGPQGWDFILREFQKYLQH